MKNKILCGLICVTMCTALLIGIFYQSSNQEDYTVTRVVDGDTIVVNIDNVETKVRLIGINCPESVAPDDYYTENSADGVSASDFTKAQLEGKQVTLEYDVEKTDCYGRTLAYVYLDGVMFNKTLMEKGYAVIDTFEPNVKYESDFETISNF